MRIPSAVALVALISLPLVGGVNRWTTSIASVGAVGEVVADPAGASVYARTTAGMYRSTDGGHRWRAINDGLPEPSNLLAFVAAGDTLYASSGETVFASFDEGEHWQRRGSPGPVAVTILAFDRTFNTLLAGTSDGAYYSSDSGKTWIPPNVSLGQVGQLVVASNVAFMEVNSALFRSKDGGKTWEGVKRVAYDFYANPSSAAVYGIAGQTIQYTTDQGNTWTKIPWPSTSIVHSAQPVGADLYVAAESGVFVFDGQSGRWRLVGSTAIAAHSVSVTPTSPRRLFAAPATGVLTLREGDRDWITANDGLPRTAAHDVDTSKAQPLTAYAATDAGLLRTDDAGREWAKVGTIEFASRVAVGSQSPDTAYAAVSTLMKTNDGGATWKSVTPSYPAQFALAPSNPATLYATFAGELKRSFDGGGTWSSISAGIPADYYDAFYGFSVSTLTVDPTNDSKLYVGREDGLYRTTDGGASWLRVSSEPDLSGLVIDPADPSTLYAAGFSAGVRKSVDGGMTWISSGLIDKRIRSVAIAGSHLYAGSDDGHVYRSDDGGQHWSGFDEGLSRGAVWRIAVDPGARLLYAATDEGLFDFQVADEQFQVDRMPNAPQLPRDSAFVLPVIGKGEGALGSFTTDLTLTNARNDGQQIAVIWLPQAGGSASATSFMVTVPSGVTTLSDVNAHFGISGIGSLVFLPADDSLSASARIWTDFHDDRAPTWQSIAPATGSALNDHTQLTVANLRHDSEFRTNTGIVNLSNDTHQFTIQVNGQRSSRQVTIAAPPWSLVQISIPDADYGDLSLVAIPDTATAFLFYGSLIDRSTGVAQTLIGSEPKPPAPPPVLTEEVWIRGNVYDGATSHCIDGALIEVVGDPRLTSRATNQCGQPFDDNYLITGMQQGATVTFRVSANGYLTQEFPVTILGDIDDQMFINFKLEKQ